VALPVTPPKAARVAAIVPAAGIGKRLKFRYRKSFVPLAGRPMLFWSLRALERSPEIDGIVVVVHRSDIAATERLIAQARFKKVIRVVTGGATRTASVANGLKVLPKEFQWVAVHDAARPLVTPEVVAATVKAARNYGAAIAAVPVVPTVKEAVNSQRSRQRRQGLWVKRTLNRNHLWAVQTPQVFRRGLLEKAHRHAQANGVSATDDSALVEALGNRVRIILGSSRNIKITTPEDLLVAEALLRALSN